MITIKLEDNPVPLVRIVAHQLKLALQQPGGNSAFGGLDGIISMRSQFPDQSINIQFSGDTVHVRHGLHPMSRIGLTYKNLYHCDHLHRPDEITHRLRHPLFTHKLLGALEIADLDWRGAAEEFWQLSHSRDHCPAGLLLKCRDADESLNLGQSADAYLIEGDATDLAAVLSGKRQFLASVFTGRIKVTGSYRELSVMSGLLDDLHKGRHA